MKNKKNENANLEKLKGVFFLIGLVVALGVVLAAFEWKSHAKVHEFREQAMPLPTDYVYIPPSTREKMKLPPPKVEAPVFELVDNETEIINEFEGFESESTGETDIDFNSLVVQPVKDEVIEEAVDFFIFVEEMPEFPGGEKALINYLARHIKYPVIAQENGIEGKVYVRFIVDEEGRVRDVSLLRGVDPALDNEALRVIRSMPKWKPGKQAGKTVKVQYSVPILFELQ